MSYIIREMTEQDCWQTWQWAREEGWNPGAKDHLLIPLIDPKGCFTGLLDGEMIACITAVHYQRRYGFLGMFIVKPKNRGIGYGHLIWNHSWDYLNKHIGVECIGLNGVPAEEERYRAFGFEPSYRLLRYKYVVNEEFKRVCPSIKEAHFRDVAGYDLRIFRVQRSRFLKCLIFNVEAKTSVAYFGNTLLGYCVARPCHVGYHIGPLFSDNAEVARLLFESVCTDLNGQTVFIDVPEINSQAKSLVIDFNMEPVVTNVRMYTSNKYQQDVRYVYGSTTSAAG